MPRVVRGTGKRRWHRGWGGERGRYRRRLRRHGGERYCPLMWCTVPAWSIWWWNPTAHALVLVSPHYIYRCRPTGAKWMRIG